MESNRPKRIAIDASILATPYRGFGRHTYLVNLLRELSKLDSINQYVLLATEELDLDLSSRFELLVIPSERRSFARKLGQSSRFRQLDPDLLFFPNRALIGGLSTQCPQVGMIFDIMPSLFISPSFLLRGKTPWRLVTTTGLMDLFLLRRAGLKLDRVITCSETSRQAIRRLLGRRIANKTRVTPLAASPDFRPRTEAEVTSTLRRYGLQYKSYLLYFGGLTVRKNLGRTIHAYRRLPQGLRSRHPFVILGDVGYWDRWIAKRNTLADLIRYPRILSGEFHHLVNGAALRIYPSLYEGFGLPPLESVASATLPIASDIPTSRELFGKLLPLFDPYSVSSIERTLREYLSDVPKRESALAAVREVQQRYRWEETAGRTLRILLDTASGPNTSRVRIGPGSRTSG